MTRLDPSDGLVIVTGAGSGLGRALAVAFCAEGFTVAGTGRRPDALEETRALCRGGTFLPTPLDVSDAQEVARVFTTLNAENGPIAILVNNAAVYPHRDLLDETPESFLHSVNINLGGVLTCSLAALRAMTETGRGRILNVSTFADLAPLPASSAYAVSKGAARILTRAMVADLADRFPGIVISDWMPGMLQTGMGIPEGLPPAQAACWGVALARSSDPSLTGTIFEMDREVLPPRGLKSRVKDMLLLRSHRPRRL